MSDPIDQNGSGQQQSVNISILGRILGFTGPNAFPWFIILVLMIGIGYLGFFSLGGWGKPIDLGKAMIDNTIQMNKAIAEHTTAMAADHKAFTEATIENTYTLSACLKPRPGVECPDIMMPDSLRKKLRRE